MNELKHITLHPLPGESEEQVVLDFINSKTRKLVCVEHIWDGYDIDGNEKLEFSVWYYE